MATVLIAGCGYVGSALALRLVGAGGTVWGLRRRPLGLPPGVRPFAADLTDPEGLRDLPRDLDAVVYAVAAGGRDDRAYRSAYVEGPTRLLDALDAQGIVPRRWLHVSSTAVYAQNDGGWVDEASPARPTEFGGRRLLEGEQCVLAGPLPATVVRLGGIYGPGRAGLVERVRRGAVRLPAEPLYYTNRIHRDDAAGVLFHLLGLATPAPLYLGVDHEPAPLQDVVRWLSRELGVPDPAPGGPIDPESRLARSNKRCSNRRVVDSGYEFRHPNFRDGLRSLVHAAAEGPEIPRTRTPR